MTRTTKLELTQINARLAAENAALRAQVSAATIPSQQYAGDMPGAYHARYISNEEYRAANAVAEPTTEKEHEYDSVAEAMANCKKLVQWDTARRYMFVVRGSKVICKIRATH